MTDLVGKLQRLMHFIRFDIWKITENELSRTRRFFFRFIKILMLAVRGFIRDRLNIRASALTYSILFAIVPLFALMVAIAKGFGVEQFIAQSLEGTYIDEIDMVPTVMGFVERYLKSTQGGIFIGIGIVILLWSVMNFFMQVENVFNSIWQVEKSRSPIQQFTTYFSTILIIPLLIIFSVGFSIFVSSAVSQTYVYHVLSPIVRFGVKFIPYIIVWTVFTILYMIIPNTHVRFKNAFISSIIAGSAFQAFQMLYINGQVYLSRYNVVYGSFAAIPLLLLWIQISCLIVLLGAEISYASQNFQNYNFEIDSKNISQRYLRFLSLFVTYIFLKQFENQQPPLSAEKISTDYDLPIRLVKEVLDNLLEAGILFEIYQPYSRVKIFTPAIDIHLLTVDQLFIKLDENGSALFLSNKNKVLDDFWNRFEALKQKSEQNNPPILIKNI